MSSDRRQDLIYPPGPHPDEERDEDRLPAQPALTLPQRLHFQLWPLRQSEAALEAALCRLSPLDRLSARLVLSQLFGGHYTGGNERAVKLCERVWGPGSVDYPIEREWKEEQTRRAERRPMPPVATLAEAQAAYHKGRVEVLRERLAAMAREEAVPSRPEFLALLGGMEDGVARAALAGLAGMPVSGERRGTRDLYDALSEHFEAEATYFATTPVGRKRLVPLPGAELLRPETRVLGQVGGRAGGLLLGSWDEASKEERAQREALCQQVLSASHPALKLLGQGGGEPLPEALRTRMERLLGHDFAHVCIHTDAAAAEAAALLGARALALGTHIYFGTGQFMPGTPTGDRLLVHELMHVVQYQTGRLPRHERARPTVSQPDDPAEREADHAAETLARQDADGAPGAISQAPVARAAAGAAPGEAAAMTAGPPAVISRQGSADSSADRTPASMVLPTGGQDVGEIGIVAWDGTPMVRLRATPTAGDNVMGTLPFNARVQVIKRFPGDWLFVSTGDGRMGYVAAAYVWSAPTHPLPEPNARLHRVAAGAEGAAMTIARRYYGAGADDWGQDLRLYVNVLAAVNRLPIPGGVHGWRSVRFQADQFIWIPSVSFARSLQGQVSSGSYSYEAADGLGVAGAIERTGELLADVREAIRLSGQYIPQAIARHAEAAMVSILESLALMAVGAVGVLAVSTAIGAALGALAGGVGAAPGAAAGFEVGMALLEWIGLGFLIAGIADAVVRIGTAFATFFSTVWGAHGDRRVLDRAARQFAEAIGTLIGMAIEAVVLWAAGRGLSEALGRLRRTALGRALGESRLASWLGERINNHRQGRSPLPGPGQTLQRSRTRIHVRIRIRFFKGPRGQSPLVDAIAKRLEVVTAEQVTVLRHLAELAAQHQGQPLAHVIPNWAQLPQTVRRFLSTPVNHSLYRARFGSALQALCEQALHLGGEVRQWGLMFRRKDASGLFPDVQVALPGGRRAVFDWTTASQEGKIKKYNGDDVDFLVEVIHPGPAP